MELSGDKGEKYVWSSSTSLSDFPVGLISNLKAFWSDPLKQNNPSSILQTKGEKKLRITGKTSEKLL